MANDTGTIDLSGPPNQRGVLFDGNGEAHGGMVPPYPASTYGPGMNFPAGSLFPDGGTFLMPCVFGEGCVFDGTVVFRPASSNSPNGSTGTGCVFGQGGTFDRVTFGMDNVFGPTAVFQGVTFQGPPIQGPGRTGGEQTGTATRVSCNGEPVRFDGSKESHGCAAQT